MELSRCTDCMLRLARPVRAAALDGRFSFAKRQQTAINGAYSLQRKRLFTSTSQKDAAEQAPGARPPRAKEASIDLSKLFDTAIQDRTDTVQRTTPKTETTVASSLANMLEAFKSQPSATSSNALMDEQGNLRKNLPLKLEQAPFKLGPMLGRTVKVDESRGRDVGAAFRVLGALVKRNNISRDAMTQRFHERGGLKRKRLKSQRWRARFRANFVEMVTRVNTMRKMGW